MLLIKTFVAASAIEGVGVFAGEAIKKGQLIWKLDHRFDLLIPRSVLEDGEMANRELLMRYSYPHAPDPRYVIYESDNGRFMNHSFDPNTDFTGPDKGFARRDIAEGEELTGDYSEFWPEFTAVHHVGPAAHINGRAH
ncbi:SET domain-containing protein-lysine N-methyltransferase [Parvularcula flava]|uniref:SET domain-containing protein-lysine N-methyltransferase n=1 Tax=Aquisalinus luteolus TaxID=1566827 RepID=A0A8J3A0I4_9PROT|nr:SET domain-containing protein-lysine N-methyltransferase [Aquisalinus luteolus]NHK26633.1 SET domain-containing protein-lysine N-methyltransferase [Aquisalinus luteolus]GGH92937.1 SET domain-containing protein-lysine N-methyltransferase [Aquisalinus luteolus]